MGLADRRLCREDPGRRERLEAAKKVPPVWERTTRCPTSTERRPRCELGWKLKPPAKKPKRAS